MPVNLTKPAPVDTTAPTSVAVAAAAAQVLAAFDSLAIAARQAAGPVDLDAAPVGSVAAVAVLAAASRSRVANAVGDAHTAAADGRPAVALVHVASAAAEVGRYADLLGIRMLRPTA